MKYDSKDDAHLYLAGSFVKFKGEPIYVVNVRDMKEAKCIKAGTEEYIKVPVAEMDFTPFKLGYYYDDRNKRTYYVERQPHRKWRQGITNDNCKAKGRHRFQLPHVTDKGIVTLLKGEYLSLAKAKAKAKKEDIDIPFHRLFSIDKHNTLRYKTRVIGVMVKNKVELLPTYAFLNELIQETVNENN